VTGTVGARYGIGIPIVKIGIIARDDGSPPTLGEIEDQQYYLSGKKMAARMPTIFWTSALQQNEVFPMVGITYLWVELHGRTCLLRRQRGIPQRTREEGNIEVAMVRCEELWRHF
jgi:hypothetical protein